MTTTNEPRKDQHGSAAIYPFRVLIRGVLAKYVSIASWIGCSLVLTPLLLRYLGTEVYGLYAALGSIGAYLYVLDLGTGLAIPKYVAEYRVRGNFLDLNKLVSSFFYAFVGIGILLVVGAFAFIPYVPEIFKTSPSLVHVVQIVFVLTVANFLVLLPFGVLEGVLYGFQKVHINYWLDTLFYLCNLAAAYLAVKLGYGLVVVTAGTMVARLVVSLLLARLAWAECPSVRLHLRDVEAGILKKLAAPSFYYFVIQVATLLIFSSDNVVISSFLGVTAVTAYSVAFKLCRLPLGLISSLATVLLPHISELDTASDFSRLRKLHIQLSKYSVFISFVVFTCLAAFGRDFIDVWAGPKNFAGMPVLICFCLIWPFNTVVQSSSTILMGTARHVKLAVVLVAEGVLNVVLSILLLHYYGLLGVALGTLLAKLMVSSWFAPWYACRVLKQNFWDYARGVSPVLFPLLPGVAMAMLMARLDVPFVPKMLAGSLAITLTFIVFFYWVSIGEEERVYLRERVATLVHRHRAIA